MNGRPAVLGQRLARGDRVAVDGKPVRLPEAQPAAIRVIAYNKPEGEICSRRDPEGRPTVFAALPRLREGRWIIVGRLDLNTTGLLLATDSGELANRLMHPGSAIEREYLVRVLGEVDAALLARLRAGVMLDDGMAAFDGIRELEGEGSNRWFAVVLREGRNREVRRLWESQGCKVSRLKRVRFGTVALGPRERRGTCRELDGSRGAGAVRDGGADPAGARRRRGRAARRSSSRGGRHGETPGSATREPSRPRDVFQRRGRPRHATHAQSRRPETPAATALAPNRAPRAIDILSRPRRSGCGPRSWRDRARGRRDRTGRRRFRRRGSRRRRC